MKMNATNSIYADPVKMIENDARYCPTQFKMKQIFSFICAKNVRRLTLEDKLISERNQYKKGIDGVIRSKMSVNLYAYLPNRPGTVPMLTDGYVNFPPKHEFPRETGVLKKKTNEFMNRK